MLKRYQVLLDEWLADFIKKRADYYDTSFSETIRIALCVYYGTIISQYCPEHKFKFTPEKVVAIYKNYNNTPKAEEMKHKYFSELYFEARKAIEHYQAHTPKENHPSGK